MKKIAIVIPSYNESEDLALIRTNDILVDLTKKFQKELNCHYDIFYVDDGSTDYTWKLINTYHLKGIKLSRNFGHQNALLAGLTTVVNDYDAIITIDADLQDDPKAIFQMTKDFLDGYEVVFGVRSQRASDSWFKRSSAEGFYKLMGLMGVHLIYNHADFRLMSARAVRILLAMPEHQPFLRGLAAQIGLKNKAVYYKRRERKYGTSKYPLLKMIHFAWQGISSFTILPLRFVGFLGGVGIVLAVIMLGYALYGKLFGQVVSGWTSLIFSIYLVGGLILVAISILGEYIGRIFTEVKARPRFIIEKYNMIDKKGDGL